MNVCLWVLQIIAALVYAASGVMKAFMFEKVTGDVPSFGALPRRVWFALGILELVCAVALIIPGALHWQPWLVALAAAVLAIESLVFVWVHVTYRELGSIIMSGVLGLVMAFVAYERFYGHCDNVVRTSSNCASSTPSSSAVWTPPGYANVVGGG
jgi:uncharacterized membrane protein YphA (DoxX/SURF4 family)